MSEPEDLAVHETSLAVWEVTSPVVAGRCATLKVGVACPSGCDLAGTRIDVYSETGTRVGGGRLGSAPWPATTALYWAQVDLAAPEAEGDHAWRLQVTAPLDQARDASGGGRPSTRLGTTPSVSKGRKAPETSHAHPTSIVAFVAVRPPEHRVTLEAIDKESGVPLTGVELRVGRFRAATSEAGLAHVEVPGGTYEVCAWKLGYEVLSRTAHVAADTTIHLEVAVAPEPEQPYWV